jgi:hypothetical protein
MKAVILSSILILLLTLLSTAPFAAAQNGDEEGGAEGCILATFCVITFFIMFIVYYSSKKKAEEAKEAKAREQYGATLPRTGYRYPHPRAPYPTRTRHPRHDPPRREVKCDLCNSKNLRTFEGGYYKCNDCRHVFYISEVHRGRRR